MIHFFSENQLVIVGGGSRSHSFLSSVEALDENKRLSCNIPSYPLKVKEHSSTVTSSGILVCGRFVIPWDFPENCYEYRSVSNSWVKMPWIPIARRNFGMIYLKGKVWALGGDRTMDIIDYNTSISTTQWIPVLIYDHCVTQLSPNQFIVIGGNRKQSNGWVSKNVMMKMFQKCLFIFQIKHVFSNSFYL